MRLLIIGDIAWDILLKPTRELVWGSDVPGHVQVAPGGCAANVAVWARRLGAETTLVGKIGDDVLGELMMRHLHAEQVARGVIVSPGAQTTRVGILVAIQGERAFVTDHSNVTTFQSSDLPCSRLDDTDLVFITGYAMFTSWSGAFLADLLVEARRRAVPVAFDPSSFELIAAYGPDRLLQELAPMDVLLANEDEARALAQGGEPASLLSHARRVVLKRGQEGSLALTCQETHSAPADTIEVVDTTGAGDAFDAAFLVEYLRSTSIDAALRAGNRLGGYVASRLGAQPVWPTGDIERGTGNAERGT